MGGCLLLNIRGLGAIGEVTALITASIFLPFFVEVAGAPLACRRRARRRVAMQLGLEAPTMARGGTAWTQVPPRGDIQWGLFLSTMLVRAPAAAAAAAAAADGSTPVELHGLGLTRHDCG